MDIRKIKENLEEQRRLGYPNFKNKIVEKLVNDHGVELIIAKKTVFGSKVERRIDRDMNWSQHMGPDFWAKLIIENDLLYTRKK